MKRILSDQILRDVPFPKRKVVGNLVFLAHMNDADLFFVRLFKDKSQEAITLKLNYLALHEFVILKDFLFLNGFIDFHGELVAMLVKS